MPLRGRRATRRKQCVISDCLSHGCFVCLAVKVLWEAMTGKENYTEHAKR
jgi:hypothetical protein